jgi:hypothetical protein
MSNEPSRRSRRNLLVAATAVGMNPVVTGEVAVAMQIEEQVPRQGRGYDADGFLQDEVEVPRSRKISEEVVVGSSVLKAPSYNVARKHSLIQVIDHVFKEEEDPANGYPVTRTKEFKVSTATKLAIVTVSGFEFWFGTAQQEITAASSRYGFHAGLEGDLSQGTLSVQVRANFRFWGKADREWTWRCHVVIQCFGEV